MIYLADIDGLTTKIGTSTTTVLEFTCDQEEADTRMFAYRKYIAIRNSIQRLIIFFPDTDVAVISCYQKVSDLEPVGKTCLKSCVSVNKQYFPIHCINDRLDFSVVKLFPVVQSITAWDSVSSLFRIGKKTGLKTMKGNLGSIHDMSLLGNSPFLSLADDYGAACLEHQVYLFVI